MKLSQYGYEFAPEMLAKHPTENRDDSRLMVINRAKGTVEHRIFKDIIEYFDEKDLFVFNDTKVFPARLYGNKEKTGAEIEIFLLRELNRELRLWDVLVDPARKIRIGNKLYFGDDDLLVAEVIDNTTSRGRTLRFLFDGSYEEFKQALFSLGETPLPKWVRDKVEPEDAERYQTIFARHEGAVAAPTAGMHFSKHLMKRMEIKGIDKSFITLHVGLGNFRTVDVEDLSKHKMDSEQFFVTDEAAEAVNSAKRDGHKIVAIGTTVMRTVETAVSTNGMIKPMEGWTNKFIFAPYEFTVADAMVTNFHLPYSTQLMMVAAFGGYETVMNAYKVAKEEGYRFGTYGDAMLILLDFFTIFAKQIAAVSAKPGPLRPRPEHTRRRKRKSKDKTLEPWQIRFCTSVRRLPRIFQRRKAPDFAALSRRRCRSVGMKYARSCRVTAASTNAGTSSTR